MGHCGCCFSFCPTICRLDGLGRSEGGQQLREPRLTQRFFVPSSHGSVFLPSPPIVAQQHSTLTLSRRMHAQAASSPYRTRPSSLSRRMVLPVRTMQWRRPQRPR